MYVNITWYEYTGTWMCEEDTCLPAVKVALKILSTVGITVYFVQTRANFFFFRVYEKHYVIWGVQVLWKYRVDEGFEA